MFLAYRIETAIKPSKQGFVKQLTKSTFNDKLLGCWTSEADAGVIYEPPKLIIFRTNRQRSMQGEIGARVPAACQDTGKNKP